MLNSFVEHTSVSTYSLSPVHTCRQRAGTNEIQIDIVVGDWLACPTLFFL